MKTALPHEVSEFENLLRKPNSDPTGFAGFFNSGEPLTGSLLVVCLPGCCGLLRGRQPFFCRLAFIIEGGGQPGDFAFE